MFCKNPMHVPMCWPGDAWHAVDAGIAATAPAALAGEWVAVLTTDTCGRGPGGRDRRDDEQRSACRREEYPQGSESNGHRRRAFVVADLSILRFPTAGGPLIVGEGGLEPPRPEGHWHLKPARLPFRHSPQQPGEPITQTTPVIHRTDRRERWSGDSLTCARTPVEEILRVLLVPHRCAGPIPCNVTAVVTRHAGDRACDQE